MSIYIEYVLLDNIVMDLIILQLMELTTGNKIRKINKLIISVIGGGLALILPLILRWKLITFLYKILCSVILVFCIKKYKNFKKFLAYYLMFFSYTFFVGGVCLGLIQLIGIDYTMSSVVMYEFEFPMGLFGLIFLLMLFISKSVIKYIKSRLSSSPYVYNVKIMDKGNIVETSGFYDTGNNVKCENVGVNIISIDLFMKLYKDIDYKQLILKGGNIGQLDNVKYVSIRGIGVDEKYLTFTPEIMVIGDRKINAPRLAVAWKNLGDYDLILHRDYIGGNL